MGDGDGAKCRVSVGCRDAVIALLPGTRFGRENPEADEICFDAVADLALSAVR